MKKTARLLFFITIISIFTFSLVACDKQIPQKEQFDSTNYKLTFEDNFDGTTLDTTKWKIDTMIHKDKPHLNGIRRAGYYAEDAVTVKDGNLIISTNYRKDGKLGEGWYTGWVETSNQAEKRKHLEKDPNYVGFSQKYGYFETRCICPAINGIWSAFWMMPDNDKAFSENDEQWTATDGCEIDIMESPKYSFNKTVNQHVVHIDGYDEKHKDDLSPSFIIKTMYSEFHTYGLEWTPEKLIFYIDGWKTYETPIKYDNKILGTPQVLEYLILSVEVGGHYDDKGNLYPGKEKDGSKSWAGDPMFNDLSLTYDFIVDYVKVMEKQ